MNKKLVLTAAAALLAICMTGCSFTSTVTRTETVTDADGKTTTHITTTTNDNGTVTTSETVEVEKSAGAQDERITATLAFENATGLDIQSLYFTSAKSEDWGKDSFANDEPLRDGYTRTYPDSFRYSASNMLWDMKLEDSEGISYDFRGLDVSKAADPQNITIVMTYDAETNSYYANVA